MRIEFLQQTAHGALHQVVLVHGGHVILADQVQDVREERDVVVAIRSATRSPGADQQQSRTCGGQTDPEGPQQGARTRKAP